MGFPLFSTSRDFQFYRSWDWIPRVKSTNTKVRWSPDKHRYNKYKSNKSHPIKNHTQKTHTLLLYTVLPILNITLTLCEWKRWNKNPFSKGNPSLSVSQMAARRSQAAPDDVWIQSYRLYYFNKSNAQVPWVQLNGLNASLTALKLHYINVFWLRFFNT